jgi:hypothetical protein
MFLIYWRIGLYIVYVDQRFPSSSDAWNILVRPMNKCSARQLHQELHEYMLREKNVYTFLRQASECGMCGGSFLHCKEHLPSDCRLRLVMYQGRQSLAPERFTRMEWYYLGEMLIFVSLP